MQSIDQHIIKMLEDMRERLALQCDGFCQLASHYLTEMGIDHEIAGGYMLFNQQHIQHFWIEFTDTPFIADYCARMWFPTLGEAVPHGVFKIADYRENYIFEKYAKSGELSKLLVSIHESDTKELWENSLKQLSKQTH